MWLDRLRSSGIPPQDRGVRFSVADRAQGGGVVLTDAVLTDAVLAQRTSADGTGR